MTAWIVAAVFALIVIGLFLYQASEHTKQLAEAESRWSDERTTLLQQFDAERQQLLNRLMARSLQEYGTHVTVEERAKSGADEELKRVAQTMDAHFGDEWRTEV